MRRNIMIPLLVIVVLLGAVLAFSLFNKNKADTDNATIPDNASTTAPDTSTPKDSTGNTTSAPPAQTTENPASDSKTGKTKMTDFTLTDLSGNTVSTADLRGKIVFLNFWATWCTPCKIEMPDIEQTYQETKDTDIVIITVNVGEGKDTVQNFINKNKYNFKVLLDTDTKIAELYNIRGIPSSFFIDQEGYIIDFVEGGLRKEQIDKYLSTLIK